MRKHSRCRSMYRHCGIGHSTIYRFIRALLFFSSRIVVHIVVIVNVISYYCATIIIRCLLGIFLPPQQQSSFVSFTAVRGSAETSLFFFVSQFDEFCDENPIVAARSLYLRGGPNTETSARKPHVIGGLACVSSRVSHV